MNYSGGFKIENKEEIKKALEQASQEIHVKGDVANVKSDEQKESDQKIEEWKNHKSIVTNVREFAIPKQLLNVLITTTEYNGLIFYGEGGIGKTVLTLSAIKQKLKSDDWEYSNGYTTPLALYEFLLNNRNKKLIILDDIEGLFNNQLSLSILKGVLWDTDGQRIVAYNSKTDKKNVPNSFIMESKIIILCNKIPQQDDISTRAMISRTIPYEVKFSYKQKLSICQRFIEDDKHLKIGQKKQISKLLNNNTNEATKDFNFRTLRKLIAFVKYDEKKAENLFRATTIEDEGKSTYLKVSKEFTSVKEQCLSFMERTGKSRRTFYRIKKVVSK